MNKMLKGKITIARPQRGDGERYVEIRIEDDNSHIRFLEVQVGLEDFTEALMGLACVDVKFETRGLEHVGKVRQTEPAKIEIPPELVQYDKEPLREWLRANHQREGWEMSLYLGGQTSISYVGGKRYANITYYRYVEEA